jgi:hypothetical protein
MTVRIASSGTANCCKPKLLVALRHDNGLHEAAVSEKVRKAVRRRRCGGGGSAERVGDHGPFCSRLSVREPKDMSSSMLLRRNGIPGEPERRVG